jgi:hypothetical protein
MRAPTPLRIALSTAVAALAAAPAPAPAAWLDEPPKLCNFKLDDPASARIPLLEAFADAVIDPSTSFGRWGWKGGQSLWPLVWATPPADVAGMPRTPRTSILLAADEGGGFGFDRSLLALPPSMAPAGAPSWLGPLFTTPVIKTPRAMFASNGFDALWSLPPSKPIPNWRCRRRPVQVVRYGGESDAFPLVRCDGTVAPEAYDRLTLMVREPTAPRPGELLPEEPDPEAVARGEWTAGVRLVHPRLLWVIQRVADAFPWRAIYVFSGYRHDPSGALPKPGTHHSMHSEARAMDINVMGIPNVALFELCHKLADVGCGYYPNNKFVHVDVRRPGSGHPFWIDVSGPSEPSRYVDAWPGVIDGGGLVWDGGAPAGHSRGEASCTDRRTP